MSISSMFLCLYVKGGGSKQSSPAESVIYMQQTGCPRYGRHENFTFFQNVGQLLN